MQEDSVSVNDFVPFEDECLAVWSSEHADPAICLCSADIVVLNQSYL